MTTPSQTIGWVDEPEDEGIVGPHVRIAGWALAPSRIRAVELRLDGNAFAARIGLPRHDVAAVRPGYPTIRSAASRSSPTRAIARHRLASFVAASTS